MYLILFHCKNPLIAFHDHSTKSKNKALFGLSPIDNCYSYQLAQIDYREVPRGKQRVKSGSFY